MCTENSNQQLQNHFRPKNVSSWISVLVIICLFAQWWNKIYLWTMKTPTCTVIVMLLHLLNTLRFLKSHHVNRVIDVASLIKIRIGIKFIESRFVKTSSMPHSEIYIFYYMEMILILLDHQLLLDLFYSTLLSIRRNFVIVKLLFKFCNSTYEFTNHPTFYFIQNLPFYIWLYIYDPLTYT